MKRVMPSGAVSNARPETILSLRQRLALLHQLERKLKWQSAVLDACRAEVISARIERSSALVNDAASRNPGDDVGVPPVACPANLAQTSSQAFWFRQPVLLFFAALNAGCGQAEQGEDGPETIGSRYPSSAGFALPRAPSERPRRPPLAPIADRGVAEAGTSRPPPHSFRSTHPVKAAEIPDCGVAVWRRLSSRPLQALALPIPGLNALSGVILQAGEDVSEPGMGINAVDPGGVDQGVDGGSAPATFIGASKGPVMATGSPARRHCWTCTAAPRRGSASERPIGSGNRRWLC